MEWISNSIFEFKDAQILFGMFQRFKKAIPYGGAKKLRLTLPPVRREGLCTLKVRIYASMFLDILDPSTFV